MKGWKGLCWIWILTTSTILHAQQYKSEHSLGADVLITFKPSNQFVTEPSPNNTLLVYVYGKYKGYKYPGLSYFYQWKTTVAPKVKLGASLACNVRYLQEVISGEYETFYSFPLRALAEWTPFKGKEREYSLEWVGGYNFKHPKKKLLDGFGGFTTGLSINRFHPVKKFGLRVGFDFYQETSFINYIPSPQLPDMVEETFRFTQFLYQVRFGIIKRLN